MADSIEFDLNTALQLWRDKLRQSPHFRPENLDELESHLRDAVAALQAKGLSADEAFLIGTRRVGNETALEPEFARENGGRGWRDVLARLVHRYRNKAIHGLIVLYFAFGCWCLWGILTVSRSIVSRLGGGVPLPQFTQMVFSLRPHWHILPLLAGSYCLSVWLRKTGMRDSWVGFFAITTAVLVLLALQVMIAVFLPMADYLHRQPPASP